jgi:hypothetical protein
MILDGGGAAEHTSTKTENFCGDLHHGVDLRKREDWWRWWRLIPGFSVEEEVPAVNFLPPSFKGVRDIRAHLHHLHPG